MSNANAALTIGSLASAAGVGVETIRFYQRRGLLREPARPLAGIRRYHAGDVARVRFIKRSQALGFRLDEIIDLLRLADGAHCDEARTIADDKLRSVREKLVQLQRIERELAALVRACAVAGSEVSCPLIDTLLADAERSAW
ncbi:MAG: MerR family transcriptional regulator [Lysobacterales bacterium CG17_big_fil_post_rev_8_21_14_2_50_64_11]|nr:MAG: MerR family transcriptional regulator [Xanthomonadales bacterium CG17_big_fil_post_rev_8_21_14_2_50_64_11]PIX61751.1 MAG: MerR family transcriptional regulator [Xanthomonadales bacterium CG_4_10_14_3_um_filter_64_11]